MNWLNFLPDFCNCILFYNFFLSIGYFGILSFIARTIDADQKLNWSLRHHIVLSILKASEIDAPLLRNILSAKHWTLLPSKTFTRLAKGVDKSLWFWDFFDAEIVLSERAVGKFEGGRFRRRRWSFCLGFGLVKFLVAGSKSLRLRVVGPWRIGLED